MFFFVFYFKCLKIDDDRLDNLQSVFFEQTLDCFVCFLLVLLLFYAFCSFLLAFIIKKEKKNILVSFYFDFIFLVNHLKKIQVLVKNSFFVCFELFVCQIDVNRLKWSSSWTCQFWLIILVREHKLGRIFILKDVLKCGLKTLKAGCWTVFNWLSKTKISLYGWLIFIRNNYVSTLRCFNNFSEINLFPLIKKNTVYHFIKVQTYIHTRSLQPISQDYWPSFTHHLCCVC